MPTGDPQTTMKKETFSLYEGAIPGDLPGGVHPTVTYYAAEHKRTDATVVIFPGGGYSMRAPHEGEGYALYLNQAGMDTFVVDYRCTPTHFPYELLDARRAVRLVRANAVRYGIAPGKVAVMGSSAGGHLAAMLCTYRGDIPGENTDAADKENYLPNAQILCYPVINTTVDGIRHYGSVENLLGKDNLDFAPQVSPEQIADGMTPPAFFFHTAEDAGVTVINSYRYATRLRELNIPVEMHVFPYGHHGLGLCQSEPSTPGAYEAGRISSFLWEDAQWGVLLKNWLILMGYLPA